MTDAARELLNELMGAYQNTQLDFKAPNICKDHLVKFCPNQLFTNTKADLGSCNLVHDDKLREAYEKSDERGRLGYESRFYARLQQLLHDLDRKIRRANARVNAEADEQLMNPHKEEKEEKAIMLDEKIKTLMTEIEKAGEEGRVDEAARLSNQVERLQEDLRVVKERINTVNPMFMNEKRLEVCDVCGALLVPNDASKRLDAHIEGKQHQGYIKIREALDEHRREGDITSGYDDEDRYGPRRRRSNGRRGYDDYDGGVDDRRDRRSSHHNSHGYRDEGKYRRRYDYHSRSRSPSHRDTHSREDYHRSRDRRRDYSRDHGSNNGSKHRRHHRDDGDNYASRSRERSVERRH